MGIIGTRTWWIKQFALLAVVGGVGLAAAGVVGYLDAANTRSLVVVAVGLVATLVAARVWKEYSNRDAVERIEDQIYGPE
jgi:phage gp29-like protein